MCVREGVKSEIFSRWAFGEGGKWASISDLIESKFYKKVSQKSSFCVVNRIWYSAKNRGKKRFRKKKFPKKREVEASK